MGDGDHTTRNGLWQRNREPAERAGTGDCGIAGVDPSRVQAFVQMRNNFPADVSQFASMLGNRRKISSAEKTVGGIGSSHGDTCEWFRSSRSSHNRAYAGECSTISYSRLGSFILPIGGMTGRSKESFMQIAAIWRRWIEVLAGLLFAWREAWRAQRSLIVSHENDRLVVRQANPDSNPIIRLMRRPDGRQSFAS